MKALILAAGLGSRLQHKTKDIPKAMVEVNGNPIIAYQLNALKKYKINDVTIVTGYKGEVLIDYLSKNYGEININFVTNPIPYDSNSSYSFWLAKDYVKEETYLHLNCDILFSESLLGKVINSTRENILSVRTDIELTNKMENVELNQDKIMKMSINNFPEASGKAYGLAKLSSQSTNYLIKALQKHLEAGDKNQNYYGIIRGAVSHLDYHAILTDESHITEVNTLTDHDKAIQILSGSSNF
jgi:L-glutamine-phosphate cytidylyltransferase